jgi:dihydroneopterin aldolase
MENKKITGVIELEEMMFYAYHGCFREEQVVGNKFVVNISLTVDCSRASQSDSIYDALNYVEVYNITKKEMMKTSHLLENVVRRISDTIHETFPQIEYLKVKVTKLNPPVGGQMKGVSVTYES